MLIAGADPGVNGAVTFLACTSSLEVVAMSIYQAPVYTETVMRKRKDRKTGETVMKEINESHHAALGYFQVLKKMSESYPEGQAKYLFLERPRENGTKTLSPYAAFLLGISYGFWKMSAIAFGFDVIDLDPKLWKEAALAGYPNRKDKKYSLIQARYVYREFPSIAEEHFRILDDDGKAESALMADVGRRQLCSLLNLRCSPAGTPTDKSWSALSKSKTKGAKPEAVVTSSGPITRTRSKAKTAKK